MRIFTTLKCKHILPQSIKIHKLHQLFWKSVSIMCFGTINRCLEGFFRAILKSIQWIFFIVNIGLVIFGLTSFGLFIYTIFWGDGEYQDQLAEELDVDTRTFKALWLVAEVLIGIAELFAWTGCKASGVNLNCLCFKTGKKSVCGLTIYSIFIFGLKDFFHLSSNHQTRRVNLFPPKLQVQNQQIIFQNQ